MAGTKNATAVKETAKQVKEYKVIGKRFKNKTGAREELEEVFKKGFKSAGFMVQRDEFVISYGTYSSAQIAKVNAVAIADAGFKAEIVEQQKNGLSHP